MRNFWFFFFKYHRALITCISAVCRSRLLEIAENTKLCYCSFISELEDCSDKSDDDSDTDESDAFIEFDWSINHLNHIKIIDFVNRSLK